MTNTAAESDHRLIQAMLLGREGRLRDAHRELEAILAEQPGHALAHHALGSLYFHEGQLDLAIDHYHRALQFAERFVLGYYDLGVALYHRGRMIDAANAFRRCLVLDPDFRAAHYRLALSLFHAGHLDEALDHFQQAVCFTPQYLMAHYHMAVIYERRGDLKNAIREYELGLEDGGESSSRFGLVSLRKQLSEARELERRLEHVNE